MRLKDLIALKSNDYTSVAEKFEKETEESILTTNNTKKFDLLTVPLSIILPSYMAHEQLPYTLECLNNQVYQNFEVVVVDNNSQPPLEEIIRKQNTVYPIKYVRIPYNISGNPNHARNVGLMASEYNNIVFLDSDMIVPTHFTANLAIKQQFTDNCLFIGFRENVNDRDKIKKLADISKDWRHAIVIDGHFHNLLHVNVNENINKTYKTHETLNILHETNYLKDFGYGNSLAYWDLSSMVIGHCISFNKKRAIEAGGFPEIFVGWGMDDIAFGANMIANNQYVIPSLNTINYHVIHKTEKESKRNQIQLKANIRRYFDYMLSDFSPNFPNKKIKQYNTELLKSYFLEVVEK